MEPKMTISEAAAFLNISVQAIHKRIKSKNLPMVRKQNRFYFGHEVARHLFELSFSNQVLVFQNIKGGVGKTELTFCLGIRANLYGARVLIIELDPQGNLTKNALKIFAKDKPIMIDIIRDKVPIENAIINISPGFDVIPSTFNNCAIDTILLLNRHPLDKVYKEKIDGLRSKYDLILIDCPPALNASVTAAALAADGIIAPLEPDESAVEGLDTLYSELRDIQDKYHVEIPLKVILNKFDGRTSLSYIIWDSLKASPLYGKLLLNKYIRKTQDFPKARNDNASIFDSFKITPAKEDMDWLTKEILQIAPNALSGEE